MIADIRIITTFVRFSIKALRKAKIEADNR